MIVVMELFCVILGLIGQSLFGVFVAKSVLRLNSPSMVPPQVADETRSNSIPLAELLGLGLLFGVGLTAWFLLVWSLCGGELGIVPSGVLGLAGFATGGPILWQGVRLWWQQGWQPASQQGRTEPIGEDVGKQQQAVCRTCQSLIAILMVLALLQTLQTPQKLWDERAIFALKARVLFEDRSIDSPALRHADFVQYHPHYPLLLPLAEQNVYALLGRVDDRWSKLIFTALYCGLVLTTAGVLQRHLTCAQAWLGALLMATIPVLMPYEYGFLCGQADAPTACYHGISLLYLWESLSRRPSQQSAIGSMLLAGLCGALAAFTKDEGIAYLMIDGAILGLFLLGFLRNPEQLRRALFGMVLFVAAASALLIPWLIHRRSLPNTTEMNYFGRMTVDLLVSRLETLKWSVPHLIRRMFWEWREWGLQWWLMLAAIACRSWRSLQPPLLLFLLDIVGSLAALLLAGMLAPAQLDEHIGGSSHRFLMQIAPVAVLFGVILFFSDEPLPGVKSDFALSCE